MSGFPRACHIYIWVSEYTRPNLVVIIIHIMFSLNSYWNVVNNNYNNYTCSY